MTVIAMPHEIGTLGRQIAAGLAERLGIGYADTSFLGQRIADRVSLTKARFDRRSSAPGMFSDCLEVDNKGIADAAQQEIRELAAYGNVLLRGWGATNILHDARHVLRLRVTTSMEVRTRRLAKYEGIGDPNVLTRMIEDADSCLATNLEPVLGKKWREPQIYNLSVAGDMMTPAAVIDQLANFVEAAMKPRRSAWRSLTRHRRIRPLPAPRHANTGAEWAARTSDVATLLNAERRLFTQG